MHDPLRPLSRRGFTLLELIIGLAVLSLVAAIAIPAHFGRADLMLENAGELLLRDVNSARRLAILDAEDVLMHFDDGGYVVTNVQGEVRRHPLTGSEFIRSYDRDAVFRGLRFAGLRDLEEPFVRFRSVGGSAGIERLQLVFKAERLVIEFDHQRGTALLRDR